MFHFDARTFVIAGDSTGDWCQEVSQQIALLPSFYPELSHWGDLALGVAFADFSQDVLEVSWAHWLFEARHDTFLDYCCWRQTRGAWKLGLDEDELAKANDWRNGSTEFAGEPS